MNPLQKIAATRRNHAVEHGTVTVLLERHGFKRSLAGRSNSRGFYIFGQVEPDDLRSAADEALQRMQQGEGTLAVSPFCGTTIAVTGILAGVATLAMAGGASSGGRWAKLPTAMIGGMLAVLFGQPIGRVAQKHITTSAHVAGLRIDSISEKGWGPFKGYWVATSQG